MSYFFDRHIESVESAYNPNLYVTLKNGRYQLCTSNAIYSYEDLYDNFTRAFQQIDLKKLNAKKVLLLGFGLGSIPYMLEKMFHQKYHYTAVEIDEAVVYLASKYTLKHMESPVEMICTDATFFVEQCTDRFDMICMDIFLDAEVPVQFEKVSFLEKLRDLLTEDGILMYNRLSADSSDTKRTRWFYENEFLPVFPSGTYLDVKTNWILMNGTEYLK